MTYKYGIRAFLLASVASMTLAPELVQAADAVSAPAAASAGIPDQFENIVVTATRREDTINRVPLSMSALSAQALEKKQIRSIDDIRRDVPGIGLQFGNNGDRASTSGDTNVSIRGISAIQGAATTGVYLDDVPIFKTATIGEGFGAAYPKSFDMGRVEVLRGPQGTLFGGSSEGGAIRFITTPPSLSKVSGRVKVEGSVTEGGSPSYELGGVLGGPILEDKLGARLTVWHRRDGGYLDHVSRFTGQTLAKDTNHESATLVRLAATWKPVDDLTITPFFSFQRDRHNDTDQFWVNSPAFNAPAVGFNAAGPGICTTAPCNFTLPAHTYPAYTMFGPGKSGNERIDPTTGAESNSLSPRDEKITVASVTADYNFDWASIKSITSYMEDKVEGINDNTFLSASPIAGLNSYPANEVFTVPGYQQITPYSNHLRRTTEEVRLTSNPADRLTWVVGAYFSIDHFRAVQLNTDNSEVIDPALRGETYQQLNGFPVWGGFAGTDPSQKAWAEVDTVDKHYAGYAEANYKLTQELKLTAGLRYSHDNSSTAYYLYGAQHSGLRTATIANGGILPGGSKDSPLTPKVSVSYQLTDRDMVYATAAKGFRPGGFNANVQGSALLARGTCSAAQLASTPQNFGPDTVWSYEIGSKLGFGDVVQVNTSAFHINWNSIQSQVFTPNCGNYVTNTGTVVSQGFDFQAQIKPIAHVTLNSSVGFDDAHYKQTISGSVLGGATVIVNQGDRVPGVPKWTYTLGINYDFTLMERPAYIGADYQYSGAPVRSTGPGTIGYRADTYRGSALHFANLHAGVQLRPELDLAFYVKNLTNSHDITQEVSGASGARPFSPQLFAGTFRPREFGLSVNYTY